MPDDVIKGALERFKESQDGSDYNRVAAEEDIRFARLGDQWPEKVKKQRQEEGRPCLTINKCPSFIRQVVNEARQNKPGVIVSPVDNGADVDTAEVITGLVRSIERNGEGAEVAYDTAIDHSVTAGFGFFRIGIDYCHDDTFDMECRIHRVPNPLMVHWDVSSTAFDASDWDYAFVSDMLSMEEFEAKYKGAQPVSFQGDNRETLQYWLEGDKIRVAEYFLREEEERDLIGLSNGTAIREDVLMKSAEQIGKESGFDLRPEELVEFFFAVNGLQETRRRKVWVKTVTRRIISGAEELEKEPWPGSMIPICPVLGDEVVIDGRRYFRSMIRDARDPQTMFNFWRSATTELVALAPRAPFIGPKGFVPRGHENKWATANTRSHSYLEFDPAAGAPQRQPFAGVPAGALQEALNASDDMKAIIGIYDAGLGARSNETSGRAILARQREGDVSNFHFIDNLNRAIRYCGQCLVEIIPAVYGARQTIRILGDDMKEKVVGLSQGAKPVDGQERLYDLTVGKYDVTVKAGPSYETQREETRATLIEIMSQVEGAAQLMGDVVMEYMDFQGADKVAKRLQMLLPPQVQQAEGIAAAPPLGPMMPGQASANPGFPAQPGGSAISLKE